MCPKAIEGKYILSRKPEESFSFIQQALSEIGLKELKVKKSVPSSYLVMEYKAGWRDKREIEFILKDRQNGSEVSIKWFYPSHFEEFESIIDDEKIIKMSRGFEKSYKEKTERLFEELKCRIGARDTPLEEKEKIVKEKEMIREKEVIVKIRCSYCHNLYDETLDKCPHCGAKR